MPQNPKHVSFTVCFAVPLTSSPKKKAKVDFYFILKWNRFTYEPLITELIWSTFSGKCGYFKEVSGDKLSRISQGNSKYNLLSQIPYPLHTAVISSLIYKRNNLLLTSYYRSQEKKKHVLFINSYMAGKEGMVKFCGFPICSIKPLQGFVLFQLYTSTFE